MLRLLLLSPLVSVAMFAGGACSAGGGGAGGTEEGQPLPLETASLEFGAVGLGAGQQRVLVLRNPSGGLTVRITRLALSPVNSS